MYYYDYETKDLAFTNDTRLARRDHMRLMLEARTYALAPETAGALHRFLGPAPEGITRGEAVRRVTAVLRELGLMHLSVEAALEMLDDSWKLAIRIS